MGDLAGLLPGRCRCPDVLNVLQRLDGPVMEVRGDHHCTPSGAAAEDGDRFALDGVQAATLFVAELAEGDGGAVLPGRGRWPGPDGAGVAQGGAGCALRGSSAGKKA